MSEHGYIVNGVGDEFPLGAFKETDIIICDPALTDREIFTPRPPVLHVHEANSIGNVNCYIRLSEKGPLLHGLFTCLAQDFPFEEK